MVVNLHNRSEVEDFLRNASAGELLEERSHLQDLGAQGPQAAPESFLRDFVARIAYELRFRVQIPV